MYFKLTCHVNLESVKQSKLWLKSLLDYDRLTHVYCNQRDTVSSSKTSLDKHLYTLNGIRACDRDFIQLKIDFLAVVQDWFGTGRSIGNFSIMRYWMCLLRLFAFQWWFMLNSLECSLSCDSQRHLVLTIRGFYIDFSCRRCGMCGCWRLWLLGVQSIAEIF